MSEGAKPRLEPSFIIGTGAMKALQLAGYEVVRVEQLRTRARYTCPECGVKLMAWHPDYYADLGEVWHRPCVPPSVNMPSRRGKLRPMTCEMVPVGAADE